jgi:hypothetical protein
MSNCSVPNNDHKSWGGAKARGGKNEKEKKKKKKKKRKRGRRL